MINTTRWKENNETNLNKVFEKLMNNDGKDLKSESNNNTFFNVKIKKNTKNNIEKLKLLDDTIPYFSVSCSFERSRNDDERVPTNFILIGYKKNDSIYYIISRNSDALLILRRLLSKERNKALIDKKITIPNGMFLWIINKIFNSENSIDILDQNLNEEKIILNNMIGIKGSTLRENTLMAQGNSISKLISTLSLLLEINLFTEIQIELEMHHQHERIILLLKRNGCVGVEDKKYNGIYENDEEKIKITKLLLLIYLQIIPIIKSSYNDNKALNDNGTKTFIEKITKKIEEKLQDINLSEK